MSLVANLRYGLSLGTEPLDKGVYAAVSVAADAFKIALPLLVLRAKRYGILSLAGIVLWLMCFGWSLGSAMGFALSTRADAVAERTATRETRRGWEAKVIRATEQLSTLGRHRPHAVIEAELAATTVPRHVWQRTNACAEVTSSETEQRVRRLCDCARSWPSARPLRVSRAGSRRLGRNSTRCRWRV